MFGVILNSIKCLWQEMKEAGNCVVVVGTGQRPGDKGKQPVTSLCMQVCMYTCTYHICIYVSIIYAYMYLPYLFSFSINNPIKIYVQIIILANENSAVNKLDKMFLTKTGVCP